MKKRGVLDNVLPSQIMESQDAEALLESILDTLEQMQDAEGRSKTQTCYQDGDAGLYEQTINGCSFADWLYAPDNTSGIRKELVREFGRRIQKSYAIAEPEYQTLLEKVQSEHCEAELIMLIRSDEAHTLYVGTPERFLLAKQWYLSRYVPKSDFISEAAECFPNLFFHADVTSSIHTLNVDFEKERPLIVEHLAALDRFSEDFLVLRGKNAGNRQMCEEFQKQTQTSGKRLIECSPQSNRESAKKLDKVFADKNGARVSVRCECHTKLKWNFKNMDAEKQDRIYFSPGLPEIQSGKVLIAYIGSHL